MNNLHLNASQQTEVEELALRRDTQTAMTRALKLWRQPNPLNATFKALVEISLILKRGDVAMSICQYVSDEVPKSKPST